MARTSAWLVSLVIQLAIATYGLHRLGWMSTGLAMPLFAVVALGAAVSLVLALLALRAIWTSGDAGAVPAAIAGILSAAIVTVAVVLGFIAVRAPALNDVSSDLSEPPAFDIIANRRPKDANPVTYPGRQAAEIQRATYPDIGPVETRRSATEAYALVLAVANRTGWQLVAAGAPGEGGPIGEIEAIDRTTIMGFVDDIAIRVKPLGQAGARIDIRSASRYGAKDFGRNAARIRDFLSQVERAIEAGELTTAE